MIGSTMTHHLEHPRAYLEQFRLLEALIYKPSNSTHGSNLRRTRTPPSANLDFSE
jgi:hypothetical protein